MDDETRGRWLFAVGKHLRPFRHDHVMTHLYATRRASQEGDLLVRLRSQGTITAAKTKAFARDVGIPPQELSLVLAGFAQSGLVEVVERSGQLVEVRERIFTEQAVFRAISDRFEHYRPEPAERAVVPVLELLSRLPLSEAELVERVSVTEGLDEAHVREALHLHEAFKLLQRRDVPDLDLTLVYNEYLWGDKLERVEKILGGLRTRDTNHLLALTEEIRGVQGRAAETLTAAPPHIVEMAVNTGIIDSVTIETASGREKTFTFSPNVYGFRARPQHLDALDISDQVKLFVASIEYGVRYSEDFRLDRPIAFVNRLLNDGTAGNATPVGRDYILLERQGIVTTEQTSGTKARFVLEKPDVVRAARDVLAGTLRGTHGESEDARFLATQRDFRSPEGNRVRAALAETSPVAPQLEHDLIAAIRESAQRGDW